MSTQPPPYVNIHGRKPGRGFRPYLLIPKVLALAVFFGSYTSVLVLWLVFAGDPAGGGEWAVQAISLIMRRVCVPALIVTLLFGVGLFCQHPAVFARRRWLQAKWLLVLAMIGLHLWSYPAFLVIKTHYLADEGGAFLEGTAPGKDAALGKANAPDEDNAPGEANVLGEAGAPVEASALAAARQRFTAGVICGMVVAAALIFLGRHKPRLGQ